MTTLDDYTLEELIARFNFLADWQPQSEVMREWLPGAIVRLARRIEAAEAARR